MALSDSNKYLPIWNALKRNGSCRITAPTNQHRKIIKMVRRTRDRDLEYLYMLSESNRIHQIKASITPNSNIITFTLTERINLNGL
jgi:hypothetical protein